MTQQLDQISESDASGSDSDISSEVSLLDRQISAWVDIGSEQLTLLRWSQSFASVLQEPSPLCAGFRDWLVEEQRPGFLAWLRATENVGNTREITLLLPRQGVNTQGRRRNRVFACMVFDVAEEQLETPQASTVRVLRLDLHEVKHKTKTGRAPSRSQTRDILLWVEMPSTCILKSRDAPTLMFQLGSFLMVVEDADEFLGRLNLGLLHQIVDEEPEVLGTYTFLSGGYQLRTETSLVRSGERWEDIDRSWCLLRLSKVQLLNAKAKETAKL